MKHWIVKTVQRADLEDKLNDLSLDGYEVEHIKPYHMHTLFIVIAWRTVSHTRYVPALETKGESDGIRKS